MCPNSTQQCFHSNDEVVRLTCGMPLCALYVTVYTSFLLIGIDPGAFPTVTNMTCLPDDIIIRLDLNS